MTGFRVQRPGFGKRLRDKFCLPEPRTLNPEPSSAFTLIEMLTTVAALTIVLGLMVSLARDVRNRSAERVTKDLLRRLDQMMAQYQRRHEQLPAVQGVVADQTLLEEPALKRSAIRNNSELARAMRTQVDPTHPSSPFYDAWGNPIVFMPRQHPAIGMAAEDRFFFVSPGPDGKYLTREDNLYSYEMEVGE